MIAEKTSKTAEALQDQFQALQSLQNEILEAERHLERLQTKFQEIKSGVAMIALPHADGTVLTRKERIAKAKAEIFTEYDHLLSELAK